MLHLTKFIRRRFPYHASAVVRILAIGSLLLFVAGLMTMFGCSNKQIYENIQYDQKLKCQKLPQSEYERCMKRAAQSYEDYKRAREEALNQD